MEYAGSTVYDDHAFYKQYMARRHREESPNKVIEYPAFMTLLGDVHDKTILDLGCGDASLGEALIQQGCERYVGLDGSQNMIEQATIKLGGTTGTVIHTSLEDYSYPGHAFDRVVSQLALHYIDDLEAIVRSVYETLKPGGEFVFSVLHPVMTASFKSMTGKRADWIVDDYFQSGKRIEPWIGEKVVKYHRTIEEYFLLLQNAGFTIKGLREGTPLRENFQDEEEFKRRQRIPLFLMMSCIK
ncbi:class I SAM-dependent DNA methyltransferase [Bacillus sp. RAR_GA_16]|uniref:class I SAM-dependent DNA methyltransferase n=1 Tax=Bacillus sp. RAR_GA_16 TaxID=2876774 RepID=UPI001CCD8F24|nr:class I SAM-dependent methyltransferase [Bacillus sp. RAR_GA_16]MCA0173172.1 class I SAM-dependent methyltransferase [Bacillus sp. RAR_GA_16]